MTTPVDNINDTAFAISEEVHFLRHLYNAQRYHALSGAQPGLTHMGARVIYYLADHPGARQGELVGHLSRDKGQVARLVAALKDAGLLDASADPADRRQQLLELTARGREILHFAKAERQRVAEQAVTGFSDAERAQMLAMLRRIKANLRLGD